MRRPNCSIAVSAALLIAVCAAGPSPLAAVELCVDEMATAKKWIETRLDAKSISNLPFSFVYDGRPSASVFSSWRPEQAERRLDENRTERTIALTDPKTGLALRCVATIYHDLPGVEWVLHLKNTGVADTPILENVHAINAEAGGSADERPCRLYYAEGSSAKITDFQPR